MLTRRGLGRVAAVGWPLRRTPVGVRLVDAATVQAAHIVVDVVGPELVVRWPRIHRAMAVSVVVGGQVQSWSAGRRWLGTGSGSVGCRPEAWLGVQYGWL